jgi:tRNA pseudouridine13 synthase
MTTVTEFEFALDPVQPFPLPFITDDLPGVGGEIKAEPTHFVVEEIPLYEAKGEGHHVYVCLTREGMTTRTLKTRLVELFDLREVDVGCAGLKDKHARTTQTFSLLLPKADPQEVADTIADQLPVEVEWVRRHRNKLKIGHLLGNRFRVVLLDPEPGAMEGARRISQAVRERGLPNFYGVQRFGAQGDNAQRGRQILFGEGTRRRWLRRFLLRAYQSGLFNTWLTERIRLGWFSVLMTGDIAKKTDTGGLFLVEDAAAERPRFERREIIYTGPIYGYRLFEASGEPGRLERALMEIEGITSQMLRDARLRGSRRRAQLLLDDLRVEPHARGLCFEFSLPKGAYATTLLREFTKREVTFEFESDS